MPFYRAKAITIIGEMGREGREALAPLEVALRSRETDQQVRAVLTTTIEKIK